MPRYVADGVSSESADAREREARSTVGSAFRQPPREPIASPKNTAKQAVEQLVDGVTTKPSALPVEQIVEAVSACAHLNPIEWAEERQRLKAVCGDGLKIADIDRMYREKKREVERDRQQEFVDSESYLLLNGRMIYRKEQYRGVLEKTVADWSASALHQICQIDDDGKESHTTTIELRRGSTAPSARVRSATRPTLGV